MPVTLLWGNKILTATTSSGVGSSVFEFGAVYPSRFSPALAWEQHLLTPLWTILCCSWLFDIPRAKSMTGLRRSVSRRCLPPHAYCRMEAIGNGLRTSESEIIRSFVDYTPQQAPAKRRPRENRTTRWFIPQAWKPSNHVWEPGCFATELQSVRRV
ncbi:hypothetical protein VTG60DRAFT_6049 [Thermothelomyces hinnuleus]